VKHYDGETLFAFLEGMTPIEAGIEEHVAACGECSAQLVEQRRLLERMGDPRLWQKLPPPPRDAIRELAAFAERVALEDELASSLCDAILTGPAAWWPQRLRTTRGTRTAGMVRQLLLRTRAYLERTPKEALQVTEMALGVAGELEAGAYPPHYVDSIRGEALRDHAYVLSFLSRYAEALDYAERAARLLETVPFSDCELARVWLVRATVLRNTGEHEEAARLAREAGDTFLAFGERARYVTARITEGAVVYAAGLVARALEIWSSVEGDPALDDVGAVRLTHNIALCHTDLGQPHRAIEALRRCIAELEMLGMEAERTRSRAVLGRALLAAGDASAAIPILRQTSRELAELGLIFDSGVVATEAAEALIAVNAPEEVAAICREVIARFTAAGLAPQAITALAYLREAEAAAARKPARLVRAARASLRALAVEP
jgi:tetratricopeptide (TPR) repeat protein